MYTEKNENTKQLNDPLKKLNKEKLLSDAGILLSASFSSTNMAKKWKLYKQGEQLKKIYKEIIKWETLTRGY